MTKKKRKLDFLHNPRLLVVLSVAAVVSTQILSSVQLDFSSIKLDATGISAKKENNGQIKLIQVMNAYSVPSDNNTTRRVSPLDQWATIQSIVRAKRYAPANLEVDFVCAMFPHDLEALPDLPCRKVLLKRSTKTEYPVFDDNKPKELPFIQDLLDAAIVDEVRQGNDNFFVMLTNSDIALTKDFYPFVYDNMQTRDAFTINRLTIPMKLVEEKKTDNAEELLDQVDKVLEQGEPHPGYDCFIVHSSVLKRFRFGGMFAGHPPWGSSFMLALRIMSNNYISFPSNVSKTFHLGSDKSKWLNKDNRTYQEIETNRWFLNVCPLRAFGDHPYTLLNTINCGKWFEYYRFYNNHTMPNFVQPGYEQVYLDNYPRGIKYTGPGGRGRAWQSLVSDKDLKAAKQKAKQRKQAQNEANSKAKAAIDKR